MRWLDEFEKDVKAEVDENEGCLTFFVRNHFSHGQIAYVLRLSEDIKGEIMSSSSTYVASSSCSRYACPPSL